MISGVSDALLALVAITDICRIFSPADEYVPAALVVL